MKKLINVLLTAGALSWSSCGSYNGAVSEGQQKTPWEIYWRGRFNDDTYRKPLSGSEYPKNNKKIVYWYDGSKWRKKRLK